MPKEWAPQLQSLGLNGDRVVFTWWADTITCNCYHCLSVCTAYLYKQRYSAYYL